MGKSELERAVNEGKIKVYAVQDELFVNRFLGRLHRGELEVIAGARELEVDYLLIDDRSVRRLAEQILLEPTGLIGLLKIAKIL